MINKNFIKKNILEKFNISNNVAYLLIAILSFALIGVGVYAYGGVAPLTVGHSMGELMPPCTGVVVGISGDPASWSCVSTPPSCNGANKILHWDGSSWICYDFNPGYECNWIGWTPACPCKQQDDMFSTCGTDPEGYEVYPVNTTQYLCSSGIITDQRIAYCCQTVGGICQVI
jgi:hypothetical protein